MLNIHDNTQWIDYTVASAVSSPSYHTTLSSGIQLITQHLTPTGVNIKKLSLVIRLLPAIFNAFYTSELLDTHLTFDILTQYTEYTLVIYV